MSNPRSRGKSSGKRAAPRLGATDLRSALAHLGAASWADLLDHCQPQRGKDTRALRRILDSLLDSGEVAGSRHGIYRLSAGGNGEKVLGEVVQGKNGSLAVRTDAGRVLPVPFGSRVREGDRVEAFVHGRTTALRVVEPCAAPLVGLLQRGARGWFVESVDPVLKGRFDLVAAPAGREGDVVEVQLLAVGWRGGEGRMLRVLAAGNEAERAAVAMLAAHRIPCDWPSDALAECSQKPAATAGERCDLHDIPFVTIDGEDARDFDDAVFAERRACGGWRLLVAIADVAHFVAPDSALDRTARERGNSVYLPDRVVPMLPEALSNGACSLVADEDRLALACDMDISKQGGISHFRFRRAVIRSRARLTYDGVGAFLRDAAAETAQCAGSEAGDLPSDVALSLRALHEVYCALRGMRERRGALDFDAREAKVTLRDGQPTGVRQLVRHDAHRMIEEAMIAANVAAAMHLEQPTASAKQDRDHHRPPPPYRVHEPPAEDKLATLRLALQRAGQHLADGSPTPRQVADACERARAQSSWPGWIWDALVLRSLAQARYEPRRLGHFGLALPTYVHFTSPIRRYADLLVHRMILGEAALSFDELDTAAAHVSMTERRAEQAERRVDAWLKCALVEDRVGEVFHGTVAAVTGHGIFVELDGLFVQGLVHISKLGRDYYHHLPESMALVGERSGDRFTLGDRLDVVVEEVNVALGRIDLRLPGGKASGRRGRTMRGRGRPTRMEEPSAGGARGGLPPRMEKVSAGGARGACPSHGEPSAGEREGLAPRMKRAPRQ